MQNAGFLMTRLIWPLDYKCNKYPQTDLVGKIRGFVCLISCFMSMVNHRGHVGMISYLTTLFLSKPPGGSLPVFSAHSFTLTDNLNQWKREKILHEKLEGSKAD